VSLVRGCCNVIYRAVKKNADTVGHTLETAVRSPAEPLKATEPNMIGRVFPYLHQSFLATVAAAESNQSSRISLHNSIPGAVKSCNPIHLTDGSEGESGQVGPC